MNAPANIPGVPPSLSTSATPGSTNRGVCSLSYGGKVFRFRTNPNEIWWDYELITHVEQTYGGRVVQLLGTKLGDLTVKVDCGAGRWDYLMQVVLYLRDLLVDQRNGNPATFEYTTRNWKLNVYGLSIPFQDEVTATTRELELKFKIQEDVTGVMSQATMAAELYRLQIGTISGPIHNNFNSPVAAGMVAAEYPPGPSYTPSGITNTVDTSLAGNNPGGLNILGGFASLFPSIPGISIPGIGGL